MTHGPQNTFQLLRLPEAPRGTGGTALQAAWAKEASRALHPTLWEQWPGVILPLLCALGYHLPSSTVTLSLSL